MRRVIGKSFLVALIMMALFSIPLIFVIKDSKDCDTHVVLDKGEYDCLSVNSYSNGTSYIKMCDGSSMTVPTSRIVVITEIKK